MTTYNDQFELSILSYNKLKEKQKVCGVYNFKKRDGKKTNLIRTYFDLNYGKTQKDF